MAKFFFNFRQGRSYQADDVGCEYGSVEDAYLGAFAAAQDMWRELLIQREDPLLCTFEVMDEHGHDLFALPFVEVLEACRGRVKTSMRVSHQPHSIVEAVERQKQALRTLSTVSATVADTRATLRETWSLLAEVSKVVAS
jgi:hypothetical protein